ncbi:MAG TPA: thiamine pyrophosphate-dependent dehydrogenase E1 component subunit alpha [Streptosporangiaceae bacterium]|nr:thiamine pyrophosphate-dependent dehydrogenase E1 component subunit alpha [Streptosporangiaceae bacterium]
MNAETAAHDSIVALEPEVLLDLHRRMVRIRLFEEEAGKLMEGGRMPGFLHLYVGQEAVAAGVMSTLRPDDVITSTHRGHGHAVAKGADLRYMYAELFGKTTGYCKGRGGSMHINDLSIGMLGANGIVGGGIPHAVGAALAATYKGQDSVAVPFFGDGATNIGAFHESANLAAVMHLPVVFVCENNGYSEFTPQERHMLLKDVADRAAAYGMPGEIVDGMDAVAVYLAARRLVARARAGEGPALLEAKTYRYYDHQGVKGLRIPYRTQEEIDTWKERDAITSLEQRMAGAKVAAQESLEKVWADTREEIAAAIKFAEQSPDPDPADLLDNVYTV